MEKYLRIGMLLLGVFLVGTAVQAITKNRIAHYRSVEAATLGVVENKKQELATLKDRERQLECLARNVYFEAGSESFEGKVAVAQVTMNRTKHPKFPNDVCQVVYQKSIIMEKVICQFSWYCQNGGRPKIKHPELYNESYEVAKKVLLENFKLSSMKDAIYFHAVYINPNWGKERIGVIGNHIFYRDKKTNGNS
jgi:spore germination cell wall hydrolase CwlJ-like protein